MAGGAPRITPDRARFHRSSRASPAWLRYRLGHRDRGICDLLQLRPGREPDHLRDPADSVHTHDRRQHRSSARGATDHFHPRRMGRIVASPCALGASGNRAARAGLGFRPTWFPRQNRGDGSHSVIVRSGASDMSGNDEGPGAQRPALHRFVAISRAEGGPSSGRRPWEWEVSCPWS